MHAVAPKLEFRSIWTVFIDKRNEDVGGTSKAPDAVYVWKGIAHWRIGKKTRRFTTREQAIAYIMAEHKRIKENDEPLYLGGRG